MAAADTDPPPAIAEARSELGDAAAWDETEQLLHLPEIDNAEIVVRRDSSQRYETIRTAVIRPNASFSGSPAASSSVISGKPGPSSGTCQVD
jgi:hypothetical protein